MSITTSQERSETPLEHPPPSLPSSPLPKRVKADISDRMNEPTPTPTAKPGAAPVPEPTTAAQLPPVSAILPPMAAPTAYMPAAPVAVPPLLIQKLSADATTPTRGSAFAAGYDLYAAAPITIKAKDKAMISTALAIAVPTGTYGRVAPRSGLASKKFLDTLAGVIDADYRGEVKVLMANFSDTDYGVQKGERVAQLILERIITPDVVEVQSLEESVRGAGGFGSTGTL